MVDNTKCETVNTQQTNAHAHPHTRLANRPATYRNIAVSFFLYAAAHVAALPRARLRPTIIAIALLFCTAITIARGWNPLKLIRCSSDFLSQDVDDSAVVSLTFKHHMAIAC